MFGFGGMIQRVIAGKKMKKREVTATEFRKAALKAGWSEDQIKQHTKLAKAFGSHVQVGNELLKLA